VPKTLLIGNPERSWREWVKELGDGHLLILDPSEASRGVPGQFHFFKGQRILWSRFYGSLDPLKSPHVIVATLASVCSDPPDDLTVQLFGYRPVPLLRHLVVLLAQTLRPDRILVPEGSPIDLNGFPVGPELVALPTAFPPLVQQAQRKAHWLSLIEKCSHHEVPLDRVAVEGARLGTGTKLGPLELERLGLSNVLSGELAGSTLLLVAESEIEEGRLARSLDVTGAHKAVVVDCRQYENVLCSFANDNGEDIGFGFVRKVDWESRIFHCDCTAIPPSPVRILRLGSLRVDANGTEGSELRPFQI
jgi:hypothetical protein